MAQFGAEMVANDNVTYRQKNGLKVGNYWGLYLSTGNGKIGKSCGKI